MELNNIEKAGKYLEAAKINQENLWKRRQIEWRTSFSLWTAVAISTGFIYINVKRPIPSPQNWIFLAIVFLVYILIVVLQYRLLKAISISNERDLDFINYDLNKAAWILDEKDFDEKPSRPAWAKEKGETWLNKEDEKKYYDSRKNKMRHLYKSIIVTILIESLSYLIFILLSFEK